MRLRYLARAKGHLEDIFAHIEQDDRSAAERVIGRIKASAENLLTFPQMGRLGVVRGMFEYVVPGLPYIMSIVWVPVMKMKSRSSAFFTVPRDEMGHDPSRHRTVQCRWIIAGIVLS